MSKSVDNEVTGVDRVALAKLEQGVGREVLTILVAEFLQTVGNRLTLIEVAAAAADLNTLIRQGHDLAAEAGSLGLTALFMAARNLETAGRYGDTASAVAIGRDIRVVAAPPLAEIKALFPGA